LSQPSATGLPHGKYLDQAGRKSFLTTKPGWRAGLCAEAYFRFVRLELNETPSA